MEVEIGKTYTFRNLSGTLLRRTVIRVEKDQLFYQKHENTTIGSIKISRFIILYKQWGIEEGRGESEQTV